MVPGLGDKFNFEIEMVEKTRDEYRSKAYAETKQPIAPAIMIDGDVIVVQKDTPSLLGSSPEFLCRI